MICGAVAVAAMGTIGSERAEYARDARIARVLALVVDLLVFGAISFVINSVYGVTQASTGPFVFSSVSSPSGFTTSTVVAWPLLSLVGLLYFLIPEALFGATPGKFWYRLRVVRLDGRPLTLRDVVIRNVMRLIDYLPLLYLVGGLSVLATRGSQRLGDRAAGTTVVYRHRASDPDATRHAGPSAVRALAAALVAAALFTIAFNYFGRPPLIVEGEFNQHTMIGADVTTYSLGSPTWGIGKITYPMKLWTQTGGVCTGTIGLRWGFLGWNPDSASYGCVK